MNFKFFKKRFVIINGGQMFACNADSEKQVNLLIKVNSNTKQQYIEDNIPFKVKPTKDGFAANDNAYVVCETSLGNKINMKLETFLENLIDYGLDKDGYMGVGFLYANRRGHTILVNEWEENRQLLKEIIT